MTERETKPRRGMSFRMKMILWTIGTFAAGGIGGLVSEYLTAPFYFGFFFTWVLVGLIGLFALAVHVTNEQNQRKGH